MKAEYAKEKQKQEDVIHQLTKKLQGLGISEEEIQAVMIAASEKE